MPRFYIPLELTVGALITLPDKVAHHCQVLRLNTGAPIVLFNGTGGSYVASLVSIEKKRVTAEIKVFDPNEVELNYAITLAQALPESSKMDSIIEKAVELGAAGIQPIMTQRCVTRLTDERAEKRRVHWQAIIESASEQCGRNRLAHLGQLANVTEWINQQDLHRRLILTPNAEQSLSDWARHHPAQAVTLMIGPEGGFTEQELQHAVNQGAIPLAMGERILRTETAGLCAITMLNSHWG
jgi:16S rRNA (uracil1498-N3)-methyltransferase